MARVAFLGLGVMGFPMAGHLQAKGHDVTVYNRTPAKAEAWVAKHGGRMARTPAAAAKDAEIVFSCVGDDPDLRAITLGPDGAFDAMAKGAIFVDHTTASAKIARELYAEAKTRGLHFIDAPVSGGQAGAENGVLTVMCGGDPEPFERARPVIACYARAVTLMGPAGAGQLTKMVNQVCIAGLLQGLSEGLNLAIRSGLDAKLVLDVISKGAAQSWQMENRGKTMVDDKFDFGFAVDWMRKDLRIAMEQAEAVGAELPVTKLVDGFYGDVQKMGGGRWDTSSLIRRLRKS
ncbi:MAG: NAD(P)-dependent oxidoreductase [Burkholderiales bacterium]|nr:NAD(P)-dependent oxidoreductase [Burkholderiales bacterium]